MIDLHLTPKEVASLLGITIQGVHKICKELELETKFGSRRKIYPENMRRLLESRNLTIPGPRRLAFHNLKGGVGKTTLAHAIGTRCSALGFRTLLIDADKQANLTSSFGIDPERLQVSTLKDLYEDSYVRGGAPNYDNAIISIAESLDLMPATLELANLDLSIQHHSPSIDKIIRKVLKPVENDYDLIIFDLAPDFNRTTLAIHAYCDTAVIPVVLGKFALSGVKLTYKHIDFVNSEFGRNVNRIVLINKFDARHSINLAQNLSNDFATALCPTVVPVSHAVENTFAEEGNIWALNRSKCPALEGFDSVIHFIFGLESWKNSMAQSRRSRSLEVESHV